MDYICCLRAGTCICDNPEIHYGQYCQAARANPTCDDMIANGDETDQDCGGPDCPPCGEGKDCTVHSDCASNLCTGGVCGPGSCGDSQVNGDETDVDCGGSTCPACGPGDDCVVDGDCEGELQCANGQCGSDSNPPGFVSGPSASPADKHVTFAGSLDEAGTVYVVVLPTGAAAPFVDDIFAGTGRAGSTPTAFGSVGQSEDDNSFSFTRPGLQPLTTYDAYFAAQDFASPLPNRQTEAVKVTFETTADATAPEMSDDFPAVRFIRDVSATLVANLDEAGEALYLVLPSGVAIVPTPTAADVLAGQYSGSVDVAAAGSFAVPTGNFDASSVVSGLQHSTRYTAFVVARDAASPPNAMTTPHTVTWISGADATPPTFLGGTPVVSDVTYRGGRIEVRLNEPGRVYYVVVPNGSTAPTAGEIFNGLAASGSPNAAGNFAVSAADTLVTHAFTGLDEDASFDVYIVAQDNRSPTPNRHGDEARVVVTVTTNIDHEAPLLLSGFPSITAVSDSAVTIAVRLDEAGTFSCVVLPRDAAEPSGDEVRAGTGNGGVGVESRALSVPVATSDTTVAATLTGLSPSTAYDAFITTSDERNPPNRMTSAIKVQFTTAADGTVPAWTAGYPTLRNVGDHSVDLAARMDEPGVVYWVATLDLGPENYVPLTVGDVLSGTGAGGAPAPASGSFPVVAGNTEITETLEWFSPDTAYDVFTVATDDHTPTPNVQTSVTVLGFTTAPDITPPEFQADTPTASANPAHTVTVNAQLNEAGRVYGVVVPASASSPTAADVRANAVVDGATPLGYGFLDISGRGVTEQLAIPTENLASGTTYAVFVVAEDANHPNENLQTEPVRLLFATPVASCADQYRNGDESDADCGGSCTQRCSAGDRCNVNEDCESGVCVEGICHAPACEDGIKNGFETDVDCGGDACGGCGDFDQCEETSDCLSLVCMDGQCQQPSCADNVKNGLETDLDCGSVAGCARCGDGRQCLFSNDCVSGVCAEGRCISPTCTDGVMNGFETDVDCGFTANCPDCDDGFQCSTDVDCRSGICFGGRCSAPSCSDGIQNGFETDVDCGGVHCDGCDTDEKCAGDDNSCANLICNPTDYTCEPPTCDDGVRNGDERGIDCGPPSVCPQPCDEGTPCVNNEDCVSGVCTGGSCAAATCSDGVQNDNESDVDCGRDCGNGDGARCEAGRTCNSGSDCQSRVCRSAQTAEGLTALCVLPSCDDGVANGQEGHVDCGGPCERKCHDGVPCNVASDCESGVCTDNVCQAPACDDGVRNGDEADVDCGVACELFGNDLCDVSQRCVLGDDCATGTCDSRTGMCEECGSCALGLVNTAECSATSMTRCSLATPTLVGNFGIPPLRTTVATSSFGSEEEIRLVVVMEAASLRRRRLQVGSPGTSIGFEPPSCDIAAAATDPLDGEDDGEAVDPDYVSNFDSEVEPNGITLFRQSQVPAGESADYIVPAGTFPTIVAAGPVVTLRVNDDTFIHAIACPADPLIDPSPVFQGTVDATSGGGGGQAAQESPIGFDGPESLNGTPWWLIIVLVTIVLLCCIACCAWRGSHKVYKKVDADTVSTVSEDRSVGDVGMTWEGGEQDESGNVDLGDNLQIGPDGKPIPMVDLTDLLDPDNEVHVRDGDGAADTADLVAAGVINESARSAETDGTAAAGAVGAYSSYETSLQASASAEYSLAGGSAAAARAMGLRYSSSRGSQRGGGIVVGGTVSGGGSVHGSRPGSRPGTGASRHSAASARGNATQQVAMPPPKTVSLQDVLDDGEDISSHIIEGSTMHMRKTAKDVRRMAAGVAAFDSKVAPRDGDVDVDEASDSGGD